MKNLRLLGLAAVVLLGAGCALPSGGGATSTSTKETLPVTKNGSGRVCAVTPQVYFANKLAFSNREITSIRENVIDPLVTYYRETNQAEVVSIMVTRTSTGINVDAIIDQLENDEPVYHGFTHPRSSSDSYPRWFPEEVPPEYRG